MKAVLISIQPKWCELIANGKKTIEVRKSRPKLETPFKVYIYCTLPPNEKIFGDYANELIRLQDGKIVYGYGMQLACDDRPYSKDNFLCKKVIGEFVCDRIDEFIPSEYGVKCARFEALHETSLTVKEMREYLQGKTGYGWHITDLKIYDKPKELGEFKRICVGVDDTIKCDGCEYYNVESNESIGYLQECTCDYLRPLKRPPQSWRYVEEL